MVKHAGATTPRVTVEGDSTRVDFAVTDDGRGFCPLQGAHGTGLQNMTDRLEALGGRLTVHSDGTGTRNCGSLPDGSPNGDRGIVEASSKLSQVPR